MNQQAVQAVASLWSRMSGIGPLGTPSRNTPFVLGKVSHDSVSVFTGKSGKTRLLIPRRAFEAALGYLIQHQHHAGNPCVIAAADAPEKAGPLCQASRQLPSGKFGVRNITYVLPILQALGVVKINPQLPSSVWLVSQSVGDEPVPGPDNTAGVDSDDPLLTANQQAFADYLVTLWTGGAQVFEHRYAITHHRAWITWKALGKGGDWWCQGLHQAAAHYSWYEQPAPKDFASIALRLRNALAANDCVDAYTACLEIFEWGNVGLGKASEARDWLAAQLAEGTLCESLLLGVELLQPDCRKSLAAFDGKRLLMNSAMTKLYAAVDPDNIIIYDGRVGAAFGLLARRWFVSQSQRSVPPDLAFRWGGKRDDPAATRDPSRDGFEFKKLGYKSQAKVMVWAELVRISNRILRRVVTTLCEQGIAVRLPDLERALFMVGYNVSGEAGRVGAIAGQARSCGVATV